LSNALTVAATGHQGSFSQSLSLDVTGEDHIPLIITPNSLSFPSTNIGTVSDATNPVDNQSGENAFPINAVTIQGDFEHTNECGESIEAGESCRINVVFSPQSEGTATGSLMIETSSGRFQSRFQVRLPHQICSVPMPVMILM
jgi:hypothetical protein